MLPLKIDYFLDALSQWCYISDRAILRIRMRYGNRLVINYHFVPISGRDPIYVNGQGQRLAYDRSEFITGTPHDALAPGRAPQFLGRECVDTRGGEHGHRR